jgi:predicted NUDIX family NTP pyrophosphohydrolase
MSRRSQVAAGVLVYRRTNGLEVLLGHPGGPFWAKRDDGVWSIPKGLVESDDLLACAQREFLEETNLRLKGEFIPLRPVRQKSGKTVHAFAIEANLDLSRSRSNSYQQEWPPGSGKFKNFPEVDRVAYFDLPAARIKILPYQLPYLAELSAMLGLSDARET